MATMKPRSIKPVPKASRKTITVICPHCGEDYEVSENGRYECEECEGLFDVDWFEVPAISQHPSKRKKDYDACGWATTKWLLLSFGALDVSDIKLREELNTDAKRGIRGWWNSTIARFLREKIGKDWEIDKGTLPKAIFDALDKRGITFKNPIRLERFSNYKDYLNDTFRARGRAAILAWRTSDWCAHWMGIERRKGRIRVMDPWEGQYKSFRDATSKKVWDDFVVIGFVRQ